MKKALVTGATGFVGSNLVKGLLQSGWEVDVIVRPSSSLSILSEVLDNIEVLPFDGSTSNLLGIVAQSNPDVVFHVASLFLSEHKPEEVELLINSNILFGNQLLEAMNENGIKNLVNTGTSWQHYENKQYSPVNLYAATKQAFEAILQYYIEAKSFKVITLKLFDTFGPNDPRPKLFHLLEKVAKSQEPLAMSPGEQLIDLVHIDDVVPAYLLAAGRLLDGVVKTCESYGISSGNPVSLKELVKKYEKENHSKLPIQWGARMYREREVMVTWNLYNSLPGWMPKFTHDKGIESLT